MAFAHGSNDAQKTMGIITLALVRRRRHPQRRHIPWEVIVVSATASALGTAAGGWRIMKTMGHKVVELEPIHGFAAETTAATVIFVAAHWACRSPRPTSSPARSRAWARARASRGPLGRGPHHRRGLGAHVPGNDVHRGVSWFVLNALGIK